MKRLIILLLMVALALGMTGCSVDGAEEKSELDGSTIIIRDLLGREVEVPSDSERFVNVGVGALRLYTYVAPLDGLVGVEDNEKDRNQTGVPYSMINKDHWDSLPSIGMGGPRGSADPELILNSWPDVIFNTYAVTREEADELQNKTGVPVIVLSYGETDVFNEEVYQSLRIIGLVSGAEKRAEEVVEILKEYHRDLTGRTAEITEDVAPRVYVGALGNKGPQGIDSTRGNYMLTNVLNANNVADETSMKGSFFIDKEQLLEWNPQYIFVDMDGLSIVEEDYRKNPSFYEGLAAVEKDRVYSQLPYVLLRTNFETAIADAYFMGTVLYPDLFSDIDPAQKADEIYQNLLGSSFYHEMERDYGPFGKLRFKID